MQPKETTKHSQSCWRTLLTIDRGSPESALVQLYMTISNMLSDLGAEHDAHITGPKGGIIYSAALA